MSNKTNPRRKGEKRTENGPKWENGGSDNSAVARARKKWKKRKVRALRRTGKSKKAWIREKPTNGFTEDKDNQ